MLIHLLSDYARDHEGIRQRLADDPSGVLDEYGIVAEDRAHLRARDVDQILAQVTCEARQLIEDLVGPQAAEPPEGEGAEVEQGEASDVVQGQPVQMPTLMLAMPWPEDRRDIVEVRSVTPDPPKVNQQVKVRVSGDFFRTGTSVRFTRPSLPPVTATVVVRSPSELDATATFTTPGRYAIEVTLPGGFRDRLDRAVNIRSS